MKYGTTFAILAAITLLVSQAQAESVSWSYTSTAFHFDSLTNERVDGGIQSVEGGQVSPTGSLHLDPIRNWETRSGSNDIVLTPWSAVHDDSQGAPASTIAPTTHFLEMHLRDNSSGEVGVFTFEAAIFGTFGNSFASFRNTFVDHTESLPIGDNLYRVTVGPFAFDSPGATSGFIGAQVEVRSPNETPEPSTFTLLGLGLTGLGWIGWKRGRSYRRATLT